MVNIESFFNDEKWIPVCAGMTGAGLAVDSFSSYRHFRKEPAPVEAGIHKSKKRKISLCIQTWKNKP